MNAEAPQTFVRQPLRVVTRPSKQIISDWPILKVLKWIIHVALLVAFMTQQIQSKKQNYWVTCVFPIDYTTLPENAIIIEIQFCDNKYSCTYRANMFYGT